MVLIDAIATYARSLERFISRLYFGEDGFPQSAGKETGEYYGTELEPGKLASKAYTAGA
jgi:hypothetical protein